MYITGKGAIALGTATSILGWWSLGFNKSYFGILHFALPTLVVLYFTVFFVGGK